MLRVKGLNTYMVKMIDFILSMFIIGEQIGFTQ